MDTNPSKILLYHFTNIRNLPSIIEHGLQCDALLDGLYVNSGNPEIKANRLKKIVPGTDKTVGEYVPFYFAPRSPMLYVQFVNNQVQQQELIYLVTDAETLMQKPGWCCSDRNAAKFNAKFFFTAKDLLEHVRWDIMENIMWYDTDCEPDRKTLRMAEFLVPDKIAINDFLGIAVYDDDARQQIANMLPGHQEFPVAVRRNWYF